MCWRVQTRWVEVLEIGSYCVSAYLCWSRARSLWRSWSIFEEEVEGEGEERRRKVSALIDDILGLDQQSAVRERAIPRRRVFDTGIRDIQLKQRAFLRPGLPQRRVSDSRLIFSLYWNILVYPRNWHYDDIYHIYSRVNDIASMVDRYRYTSGIKDIKVHRFPVGNISLLNHFVFKYTITTIPSINKAPINIVLTLLSYFITLRPLFNNFSSSL